MPTKVRARKRKPAIASLREMNAPATLLRQLERKMVGNIQLAQLLWDEVLDDDARARLGGEFLSSFDTSGGAIEIWQKLYDMSRDCAVVELAFELNLITRPRHRTLSRYVEQMSGGDDHLARRNRDGHPSDIAANAIDAEVQAYAKRHLLVLLRRGELLDVYWSGRKTCSNLRFGDTPVRFLWYLMAFRGRGVPLSAERLVSHGVSFSVRDAKYRLMKLLGGSVLGLANAISSRGDGGYCLELEANEICLLAVDGRGHVRKTRGFE